MILVNADRNDLLKPEDTDKRSRPRSENSCYRSTKRWE